MRMRGGDDDDLRTGRFARLDTDGRILEHQAVSGRHAQFFSGQQVAIGFRLACLDVFRRHHDGRYRHARRLQAGSGQRARRRGDDGPLRGRQRFQKAQRTRDFNDPFHIDDFRIRDALRLALRVDAGQAQFGDGVDRARAVDGGQKGRHVEALSLRPRAPDAFGGRDGIDDGAVHVEQKSPIAASGRWCRG
ncbi:hypothetical protein D3C72_1548830 [compost metagenome]